MKWKNLIKFVRAKVSRDAGDFQEVDCRFRDKNQTLKSLNPYGVSSMPPKNSLGIALSINGYEDTAYVIVDNPKKRFKGLKEGEIKIGNFLTGASVHFKADGSIELEPAAGQKVKIIGELEVSGKVTTLADFVSPSVSSYEAHVHTDVTSGSSNTGGPA